MKTIFTINKSTTQDTPPNVTLMNITKRTILPCNTPGPAPIGPGEIFHE